MKIVVPGKSPLHRHPDQDAVPLGNMARSHGNHSAQAGTSLWLRFAEWVCKSRKPQDMTLEWTCCGTPMRDPSEAYLGRVESFDLSINACTHCGALWLSIHSMATSVMRSEPLARSDAEAFLAAEAGTERRALMRAWLGRHIRQTGSRAARS